MIVHRSVLGRTAARMALLTGAALLFALVGSSRAAAAEGPEWRLISVTEPTHISLPSSQVDRLSVSATEGTYSLLLAGHKVEAIPFDATAGELQSMIEAVVGAGTVTVSGGPGDESGSAPYLLSFEGELADQTVNLEFPQGGVKLSGGRASATVAVLTHGSSSGVLVVSATNVGGASSNGEPITIADVLPAGLEATAAPVGAIPYTGGAMSCEPLPALSCSYSAGVGTGGVLLMEIPVNLTTSISPQTLTNEATVTGGGAEGESVSAPVVVDSAPAPFGLAPGSVLAALSTSQAGAHPDVTTAFTLSTKEIASRPGQAHPEAVFASGSLKDVRFDLPPGLVGSAVGMPQCTMALVEAEPGACPSDTIVGALTAKYTVPRGPGLGFTEIPNVYPVYNIKPSPGEPVAFASKAVFPVRIDTSVLSNGDYGARVTAPDLLSIAVPISNWITIWGVPAEHQGPGANGEHFHGGIEFGGPLAGSTQVPLLTSPQQCSTELSATAEVDSWEEPVSGPGPFPNPQSTAMGTLTGCDLLPFTSSFSMLPDTLQAGAPAGYTLKLTVPQRNEVGVPATPTVRKVTTTLPLGTVISPSAAWGLLACSDAQFFGDERGTQSPAQAGACPRESQVGTVKVKTPALPDPLTGQVFLAQPECDPCTPQDAQSGSMVRLFIQLVGEGESGIVVKLQGKGEIDQQTGQLTTVFDENPPLPFSELELRLAGGPRASLANPRSCGAVSTSMDLQPWSTPFTPDSLSSSSFEVSEGCFAPAFSPSFTAGTTNIQAGEYGPFTLSFGRSDHDQFLSGVSLRMPPGLLGKIAGVSLCKEPQANEGTCAPDSLIGHVQVLTGPGANPFLVTGGQVFLTESYKGAPYGLSIVVPAKAGPYTLSGTTGKGTVVVRSAIQVDPADAHLTVTSDPLPTMLDGIPLQLRVVNVTIDRPGFTFNPTNCSKLSIGGTLSSDEGASAGVSSSFQVTNCASLGFRPGFVVSTRGRTSKASGASLDVRVTYPAGGVKQANIAKVKVDLPKQLPSRLTTLQKACVERTFAANPAACPVASRIGVATASTPVLPVPLSGPAYFVSHGGAKFPELIIVLQGDGVTVQLHGETFISKAGVTSSTFRTVPDVPINSFELKLPQGPYSALAANGNLCNSKLTMPTAFTGQNGAVIHQSTKISVTGCPRHKKAKKKPAGKGRKHHKHTRGK